MLSLAFALALFAQDAGQDAAPVNGPVSDHAEMPAPEEAAETRTEALSDAEHNATSAQQNSGTILQSTTTQGVGLDVEDPDAEPQD